MLLLLLQLELPTLLLQLLLLPLIKVLVALVEAAAAAVVVVIASEKEKVQKELVQVEVCAIVAVCCMQLFKIGSCSMSILCVSNITEHVHAYVVSVLVSARKRNMFLCVVP